MTGTGQGDHQLSMLVTAQRQLQHDQLLLRACKVATGLQTMGIMEGDAVALLLRNDFAFCEAAVAANLVGAYAVPINWHFKAEEVNYILSDSKAKVLVGHADLLAPLAAELPEDLPVLQVATPQEILDNYGLHRVGELPYPQWEPWLAELAPWQGTPAPSRTNTIYTSGTTGNPKGVVREPETPESSARMARFVELCFGFTPGEPIRTVITGPMYHSAPNLFALMAVKGRGFVAIQDRFDPEQLLAWIERYRITHLNLVPIMFVRLLKLPQAVREKYDLSSLKVVTHAAAPCDPKIKAAMIKWWGPVLREFYGGTETGGVTCCLADEALAKPGSVGRAIENAEVQILGPEQIPLPAGEVGEIYVWHHGFPDFTYLNRPGARRDAESNGLISLGDLGYLDDEGYLFICDRVRDMVISGGVNIYPAEIEGVLQRMDGVKDCAVFGIPDDEFGEVLCAHIEPATTGMLTGSQVLAYLGDHLAKYKLPRKLVFTDQLPREDSGKIFKRRIRDQYWAGQERRI